MAEIYVPMYGSSKWLISNEGVIFDQENQRKIIDPWRKKVTLNTEIMAPYKDGETRFSYGQRLVWSFFGKSAIPFYLWRTSDIITLGEIRFDFKLEKNSMYEVIMNGEVFRMVGPGRGNKGCPPFFLYVNRYGALLEITFNGSIQIPSLSRWKYVIGYPRPECEGFQERTVHNIVYDVWGEEPIAPGMIVHHKDECHWNADIDNLQQCTRPEHAQIHSKHLTASRMSRYPYRKGLTEEQVRFIAECLVKDMPFAEIAAKVSNDPEAQGSLQRTISGILNREKYAGYTQEYDFSKYHRNRGAITDADEAKIRKVCELLSDPECIHSELEIHRLTKVPVSIIHKIRIGKTNYNPTISRVCAEYNINSKSHPVGGTSIVDLDKTTYIRELCEKTNLNNTEIANHLGISGETVRTIRNGSHVICRRYFNSEPVRSFFTPTDLKYKTIVSFLDPALEAKYNAIENADSN